MPNTKSAKKELRKTEKRTARNNQTKRRVKDLKKELENILNSEDKSGAKKIYDKIQKTVDKASKTKHPFTPQKASRIKSRLAKKINQAQSNTEQK